MVHHCGVYPPAIYKHTKGARSGTVGGGRGNTGAGEQAGGERGADRSKGALCAPGQVTDMCATVCDRSRTTKSVYYLCIHYFFCGVGKVPRQFPPT